MPAPGDRYDGDSSSTEDDESVQAYASFRNGESSSRSQYTFSNLFQLESLMNLQLPRYTEGPHSGSSSDCQSDHGNGNWRVNGYINGIDAERPSDVQSEMTMKRKRVQVEADAGCNSVRGDDSESNDEDEDDSNFEVSEEHYRNMLSEHLQRHKRARVLQAISSRSSVAAVGKRDNAKHRGMAANKLDMNGLDGLKKNQNSGVVKQYARKNRTSKDELDLNNGVDTFGPEAQLGHLIEHCTDGGMIKSGNLDHYGDPDFRLQQSNSHLAHIRHLPGYVPLEISEVSRSGNVNSIVPMMVSDPRAELWHLRGVGDRVEGGQPIGTVLRMFQEDAQRSYPAPVFERDPLPVYSRDALPMFDRDPLSIFNRDPVPDIVAEGSNGPKLHGLDGPGAEGFDGSQQSSPITRRQISSDGGALRHFEVKVMERGDGYEVIQRRIQKEESKRDPDVVAKEDFDKIGRYWASLVRKDLPKHQKLFMTFHRRQLQDIKRFAEFCQREVKTRNVRSLKLLRAAPMRTRRLARDMVIFWKKVDKEQAELRRKEEKDAADSLKREEELREAKRQQQRLNFLLTQTELYSHFMQNKLGEGSNSSSDPASAALSSDDASVEAELKEEALRVATKAASQQMSKTNAFDSESNKLRQAAVVESCDQDGLPADSVQDIDLLNPSTMPTKSSVQQPKLFQGILKEYQLKGLQWLVNCYEQGLNGILADEMGLGKTIQAMAFLAHLAEEKKIWGPFLVVAPASVLNNWADEVNRFCPDLKILPYWGGLNERTVLRKNINPKRLYKREAVFHVLITSYQLLVSDEKYFRRVKWQYMILDEAQAIKSANSLRWKTLLSFNCRNRLLLTGTPIQNSMAELWALLHFIMPTLFDSHEQFSEWFSKGIESHAEHGGTLNEHQLTRLHAVLKPFMLRRVKKDVITEMTNKKEVMVPCTLSTRQQAFYRAIKNKISVADLFDSKGAMNEKKVLNLMNIVIQLRKVCNHPELFERNEGHSFLQFARLTNSLLPPMFGELEDIHYSGSCNPISYKVPKLLFREGMQCLPTSSSGSCQGFLEKWLWNRFSIFSSDHVHNSIFPRTPNNHNKGMFGQGGFGFSRVLDLSPSEVEFLAKASTLERWLYSFHPYEDSPWVGGIAVKEDSTFGEYDDLSDEDFEDPKTKAVKQMLSIPSPSTSNLLHKKHFTGPFPNVLESLIISHTERFLCNVGMLRMVRSFIPPVQAPQIDVVCSDRGFAYQRLEELENPWISRMLVGFSRTSDRNGPALPGVSHHLIQEQEAQLRQQDPLLSLPFRIFGSAPPVQSFDFAKMLTDSGKLHALDSLLKRLRAENHRVLLFAQMTKMLNILEDYMNYRKYKYLRLDGSSTIMDRRDMVKDFQHRGDIFVFLLSTRAGGLGINLTAADTVIFYESDWNPTMDLQAMDRAHRLGQTKEVTVYRMICRGTVEEKIMKRASQKNTVQQLVMTGGQSQGDVFQAEEVVSLLLDDAELEQRLKEQKGPKLGDKADKRRKGWGGGSGKGVRLDAEGGGVSLDEGVLIGVSGPPTTLHEGMDTVADGGPASGSDLGTQKISQTGGRKRNRNEGRAPRAPKAAKEPKPPKEPKLRKDRIQPRVPRPPRDPRTRVRGGGPKKTSEKTSGTGDVIPSESNIMLSSISIGFEQNELVDKPVNGETSKTMVDSEIDLEKLPIYTNNGETAISNELSAPSSDINASLDTELSPDMVPGKSEPKKVRVINKKSVADGVLNAKERSRAPKQMRVNCLELENDATNQTMKSKASRPLIGTLKLSLRKQPAVEGSLSPVPAEAAM